MQFLGNYRGKVLVNDGELGRCKIYVPSIFPQKFGDAGPESPGYAAKIPWAEPAMPLFGGSTDNQGMCSVPAVGSTVWCFFESGDIKFPVYFAAIPGGKAWVSTDKVNTVLKVEGNLTIQASGNLSLTATKIFLNEPTESIEDN